MNPGDIVTFMLLGLLVLIVIIVIWIIFRKRKKWAFGLTMVLLIGYIGYFLAYPTIKINTHAKGYEQVVEYLETTYPNRKFKVSPEHFEEGFYVRQFDVNDVETPLQGVTLRVDRNGNVTQVGTWESDRNLTQRDLWKDLGFHGYYSLDDQPKNVAKVDEWIKGELTAFALTIDGKPAIAVFHYSKDSIGLYELKEGEKEGFVSVEVEGHVFIYIDEQYKGEILTVPLKNGEEYRVNAADHKGKLIVEKL